MDIFARRQAMNHYAPSPLLQKVINLLEESSKVKGLAIDVGCGYGRDTKFLIESGFEVLSFDSSPKAVAIARKNLANQLNLESNIVESTYECFQWPRCQIINASFCLFFCPPHFFSSLWKNMYDSLEKGGVLCGHLIGPMDSWSNNKNITSFTKSNLLLLIRDYNVLFLRETKVKTKEKHWHVYHLILQK